MISVAFISNYFNHHQSSFSNAMAGMNGVGYYFIETGQMSEERKKLGYGDSDGKPDYVLSAYESEKQNEICKRIINEADVVIMGSAPDKYIEQRHKEGKFIFRYCERFYKKGCPKWKIPIWYIKNYFRFGRYKNDYLLCASAFTAADAAKTNSFVGKAYKWGYFPFFKEYDLEQLFSGKMGNKVSILWAGRLIGLKHPEASIFLAEKLKNNDIDFSLNIIGCGEMENELKLMIQQKGLSDCVQMLGAIKPAAVREYMEKADIFLFTSDFNEGWGAVLNESMNSACAVVASHAIGSVPFLIKNWENGVVYQSGNVEQLTDVVHKLIDLPKLRKQIGSNAYKSISELWNASVAAERLLVLYNELCKNGTCSKFVEGPCSRSEIVEDEWYKINDPC